LKRKRLTQKEIKARAEAKKSLQERGVIPPDKPRLNRRKFAKEVLTEFEETMGGYECHLYLLTAIGCMVAKDMREVTPEEVGVLKLLKIAIETKKFEEFLRDNGITQYPVGEYVEEVVLPVRRL